MRVLTTDEIMTKVQQRKRRRRAGRNRLPKGPNGGIELLLIQSVEHLGQQGEIVEVRPGYANNYLLPQGLATIATDHHKRMAASDQPKSSRRSSKTTSTSCPIKSVWKVH